MSVHRCASFSFQKIAEEDQNGEIRGYNLFITDRTGFVIHNESVEHSSFEKTVPLLAEQEYTVHLSARNNAGSSLASVLHATIGEWPDHGTRCLLLAREKRSYVICSVLITCVSVLTL